MEPHERTIEIDKQWVQDVFEAAFQNHIFQRVSAKRVHFKDVDFRYSTFDNCYLRLCAFDSCDFTGCRFVGSNFHGSTFSSCNFEYAAFDRTLIESDILDNCSPQRENLKLRFARTLRTNYQALGDSDAVNKAILVELDATRVHLKKAWRSGEPYYRRKYQGFSRIAALISWLRFVLSDFIWGNGERPWHLVRTLILLIIVLAAYDTFVSRNAALVTDWLGALADAPQVFLGTRQPIYPGGIMATIALIRYVVLGLFVSVLVRRFARR